MATPYAAVHKDPQGPGDARPTAKQVIKDQGLVGKLKDRCFLVTGANSGLGKATCSALHAAGATIVCGARDVEKGKEAVQEILKENADCSSKGELDVMHLDLASLAGVRSFSREFLSKYRQLNTLICNAGIMACPQGSTEDGFETQFGTNHVGHYLLFQLLKPTLLASSTPQLHSRVVCLSSLGHRSSTVDLEDPNYKNREYTIWGAYGQSKTANIWMANEIERRYGAQGLHGFSVHPGGIMTNLGRHLPEEMTDKWKENTEMQKWLKNVEQGAATTIWAAVGKEWEGKGGKYLEDCGESPPAPEDPQGLVTPGHLPYAYDAEGAKKLWELSAQWTGVDP